MIEPAPFHSEISGGPSGGEAFWVRAADDVRLRIGHWQNTSAKRGSVLIFPGRTEYIELHGRTASDLFDLGFSALAVDWRGQGLSDRIAKDPMVTHVNNFLDYQHDVLAMLQVAARVNLPKPWFLLGVSMGGCIGLRAIHNGLSVSASAFAAPMWAINLPPIKRLGSLPAAWAVQTLGYGEMYCPGYDNKNYVSTHRFADNRMTHNPDMFDYWVQQAKVVPALQTGGPSMGWLFQSLNECRKLSKLAAPKSPAIAFGGDQDEIVDVDAIAARMARWPGGTFEPVVGAKHVLLFERQEVRVKLFEQIAKFF